MNKIEPITYTSQNGRWGLSLMVPTEAGPDSNGRDSYWTPGQSWAGWRPAELPKTGGHDCYRLVRGEGITVLLKASADLGPEDIAPQSGGRVVKKHHLQGNGIATLLVFSPQGGVFRAWTYRRRGSNYYRVHPDGKISKMDPGAVALLRAPADLTPEPAPEPPSGSVASALKKEDELDAEARLRRQAAAEAVRREIEENLSRMAEREAEVGRQRAQERRAEADALLEEGSMASALRKAGLA